VTPASLPGALPLSGDAGFANQLALDTAGSGSNRTGLINNIHSAANAANTARAAGPQTSAGIQVAIHLARAVQEGLDRINIRLNPAELGRVDVKLEVRHDGTTMAIVAADRQETIDLLQRDAKGLERALQEAGIKADAGSMSFNLRQNGQNNAENASNGASGGQGSDDADADGGELAENQLPAVDPNRLLDIIV
jgi:flagellar hook-length control protein FliK